MSTHGRGASARGLVSPDFKFPQIENAEPSVPRYEPFSLYRKGCIGILDRKEAWLKFSAEVPSAGSYRLRLSYSPKGSLLPSLLEIDCLDVIAAPWPRGQIGRLASNLFICRFSVMKVVVAIAADGAFSPVAGGHP